MNGTELIDVLRFSIPMLTALVCVFLIIRCYRLREEPQRRTLITLLVLTKSCSIIAWFGILCYTFAPNLFVHIHCVFYLALLLNHIFFIHFVYILTGNGSNKKISVIHYVIPVIITASLAIWSAFVPFDAQYYIVTHNGAPAEGYEVFSIFFISKIPLNLLYNIFYDVWAFILLRRYHRNVVNYSADNDSTSLGWLCIFIIASLCTLIITVPSAFVPRESLLGSTLFLLPIAIIMIQGVIIAYNMIAGNYLIIYDEKDLGIQVFKEVKDKEVLIKQLEKYMQQEKPYLNPQLKITDFLPVLQTNRTTISKLVNSTYEMNFSNWVNKYRLEEFEKMSLDPHYKAYDNERLAEVAGFGSYRNLMRVKKILIQSNKTTI